MSAPARRRGAGRRSVAASGSGARRSPVWPLVLVTLAMGAMFLAVLPIRTYLAQRHTLSSVSSQLATARAKNAQLSAEITALNTPSEIQQIARSRFGFVQPGQESYVILPAPASGSAVGSVPEGAALAGAYPAVTAPAPSTSTPPSRSTATTITGR